MLNKRFLSLLVLSSVVGSSLVSADASNVCQVCESGNGSFSTLNSQYKACLACENQEQSFAIAASQPVTPSSPPLFNWASRWYVGVGGGWALPSTSGQNVFTVGSSAPNVYEMENTTSSYLYGGDVGMAFRLGAHWFPTAYLSANSWEIGNFNNNIVRTSGASTYDADVETEVFTALFNASIDLYRWYGLAPFIGGGAGWADASLGSFTESFQNGASPATPFSYAANSNQLFVYDVIAGLHYQMGNNWQLQLNYMYLPIGTVKTGLGNTGTTTVPALSEKIISNDVLLAVHYIF